MSQALAAALAAMKNRPFVSSAVLSMPWATDVEAALVEAKVM